MYTYGMATKYEWTRIDHAAQQVLADAIDRSGKSYRRIADECEVNVSFARIKDIHNGLRAPVRLSEFIAICWVCGIRPEDTIRQIIVKAAAEEDASVQDADMDAPLTADEIMTLAANTDPNRDMEAETPRD